jgi:glutaredoxin-like protein NrdH
LITKVFTKPSCIQCDATKLSLEAKGHEFQELALADHPEELAQFKAAGHLSAPIVVTENETWAGFRPDKIEKI